MLCAQRVMWKAARQGDGVGPGEPSLSSGVTAHTLPPRHVTSPPWPYLPVWGLEQTAHTQGLEKLLQSDARYWNVCDMVVLQGREPGREERGERGRGRE